MRIAAIADLHCRIDSAGAIRPLLEPVQREGAEVLIMAGDLTDLGLPDEMAVLLREIEGLGLPIVAVLGNHDFEHDQADRLAAMLVDAGVTVLDGTTVEIGDVAFAGIKGFCGGFDELFIQPFGERPLKAFVQQGLDDALRLEAALLAIKDKPKRVAVLHYAPIIQTLQGEPREIYPFLGSSCLGKALDRYGATVAVHGHTHHGALRGRTEGGVLVHNVSRWSRTRHGRKPFYVFEV